MPDGDGPVLISPDEEPARESPPRRRPEGHFRRLADAAPVLLWTAADDEQRDFLNQSWLDFTGRSLALERGVGWFAGVHADDRERCSAVFRAALAARQPFECEYRLRRFDGEYRWFLDRATPRFAPDGAFLGYVGACTDITDRKSAEAEREEALTRLASLLRVSRRLASEADARALLTALVHEAEVLLRADAGAVHRWQEDRGGLVTVFNSLLPSRAASLIPLGHGATGLAAERRAPVVIGDYAHAANAVAAEREAGVRTALAVPLIHQSRLLGALAVFSRDPGRRFSPADVELLELLGTIAAAALVGVERARLDGALLAANTAQHEVYNRLALMMGYVEIIGLSDDVPPRLREAAEEALRGVAGAVEILDALGRVRQLAEKDWGPNMRPTIDLRRSSS
ncbi:MAG TPA: GAF domain-containing protein [Chloroflexota bacterium]|nr:GAF domain-containing protein [Chloroflexota bacterium]